MLTANDSKIVQHNELPVVTNEVSITLRLNIISHHDTKWACVFHRGIASLQERAYTRTIVLNTILHKSENLICR